MQTQGKLVVVKRQVSDQVWYEAVSLQQYKWEQTHALQTETKRDIFIPGEKQLYP